MNKKDPIIVEMEKQKKEVQDYRDKFIRILEEEFGLKESFMEKNNLFPDVIYFSKGDKAQAYINLYDTKNHVICYKCNDLKEFFESSRFDHFIDFFVGTIRELIPSDKKI